MIFNRDKDVMIKSVNNIYSAWLIKGDELLPLNIYSNKLSVVKQQIKAYKKDKELDNIREYGVRYMLGGMPTTLTINKQLHILYTKCDNKYQAVMLYNYYTNSNISIVDINGIASNTIVIPDGTVISYNNYSLQILFLKNI